MRTLALPAIVAFLAACSSMPPERVERDRAVLAAIEPCKQRYADLLFNVNMISVEQDGRIRYWHRGDRPVAQTYEVDDCIGAATKEAKITPWGTGRLTRAGPTSVTANTSGKEVLVPVRVNGVEGLMVLNRNSGLTIATPAYAKRAGLQLVAESPSTRARLGGKEIVVPFVRARSIEVGAGLVEAFDIAVHDVMPGRPGVDGVLGASFLSHFRMSVDRRASALILQPVRPGAALAPVGREWPRPSWAVGDEWEMRWEGPSGKGTYVQAVEREESVDGVAHYVLKSAARRTYYIKDTLGWHFEKDGEDVTMRRTPALTLAWPLAVGKSWQHKYERREGRNTEQITLNCSVLEETTLRVPAGTFDTLRIRCENAAGRLAWEWWHADEVKHWVRRRSWQSAGDRIDELVSYSPAPH
jgi:Aspartyl protease